MNHYFPEILKLVYNIPFKPEVYKEAVIEVSRKIIYF